MGMRSPKVDQYIARSASFAKPILAHLREVVHEASPDLVEEIKWGFPFFSYRGEIVCAIRGFTAHCGFHFWKGELVVPNGAAEGMGQFGKLTSVEQLPSKSVLIDYVKKGMQLNEDGVAAPFVAARREKASAKKSAPTKKPATAKKPAPAKKPAQTMLAKKAKAAKRVTKPTPKK
jgi:hypothetical protein